MDEDNALRGDSAALAALCRSLPAPLWLMRADGGEWRVRRRNAAAAALGGTEVQTFGELMAALPEALRHCLAGLEPGGSAAEGGWTVLLEPLGRGFGAGRLLLLLPQADAASGDAAADQAAFSYTVSHDLRAPLRVVEGFARILKEDYGRLLDRIGNDHLDRVLGASARMNHMIDALLALAQLGSQPLVREPVNLTQLAGFVIDDLRRQQPDHPVETQVQPGLMAHGDPTLLRMLLENLLGNAWKYSGKCENARIGLESSRRDGRDVFVVRDNGAGFDMRFADRLFGVFQRLHSANDFPGTGIGLASVRRIVRRHGGDIWAEAEVGRGARFYFTL
jgi:signal transduction histidine kinase